MFHYFKAKLYSKNELDHTSGFIQALKTPTIIIIDDDESCNISLRLMLHDLNFNIVTFTHVNEALKYILLESKKINLILLDLMMPEINGIEVIKKIKNNKSLAHIPLILQTGMTERKFLDEGFKNGMSDYIFKPYIKSNIIKVIQSNLL